MWSKPSRITKLTERIDSKDPLFVITTPSNITYLTGVPSAEGAVLVSAPERGYHKLLTNILEYYRFRDSSPGWIDVLSFYRASNEMVAPDDIELAGEDPVSAITNLVKGQPGEVYCDLGGVTCETRDKLKELCKNNDLGRIVQDVRSVKDHSEIQAIKTSIEIAEEAFMEVLNHMDTGVTELELAGKLGLEMRKRGGEKEAFPTIIAFGEKAAYPHAIPGERKLSRGELVLVDWGTVKNNYNSDMTRTFIFKSSGSESMKFIETVNEAVETAIEKVEPGVKASEIDGAARKVLEKYGLASKFIHGLGHGVGVEVHEAPYIRPGSDTVLREGMVFTIEPGVYIHGKLGVRIEEMVEVTSKGAKVLTGIPRILT